MKLVGLAFLLLLLALRPARAQTVPPPDEFYRVLPDSLRALQRYEETGQEAAVERLATFLLRGYPGRVAPSRYPFSYYYGYPQNVYRARALVRTRRRDFRGAEADLSEVLRCGDVPAQGGGNYFDYNGEPVKLLRESYYARALLRLEYLHNRAGGCADMGASYQLDTVAASAPRWRGCPLPAARLPLAAQYHVVQRATLDSLGRVQAYLRAGRPAAAARLLRQLRAGRVGPWAWVPVGLFLGFSRPELSLAFLESQLARQQGRYDRARALLDSLVQRTPLPFYRYELGILRIDQQNDRAGGCDDLRWVYDHDSTRTGRGNQRWRGCPLPRYKIPYGAIEVNAYRRAYQDSLSRANQLLASAQPAPAARLLTQLLTTGAAGRYAPQRLPLYSASRPPFNQTITEAVEISTRDARSRAYVALADYPRAVAELDTLIRYLTGSNGDYVCRRGALKADYLHNQTGACQDLTLCYERGLRPSGSQPWRGCDIAERQLGNRLLHNPVSDIVLYYPEYPILHVGAFGQGDVGGVEVECLFGADKEWGELNFGPAVGLELAGNATDFVFAPKISYEVNTAIGGRLDLTYNLNQHLTGDLRLTPQVGLSLGGLLSLYYGYAFPVAGTELPALGHHRITLYINFLHVGKFGG